MEEKGLFEYFKECYTKNYANFEGRARRKEYWGFVLFFFLVYIGLAFIVGISTAVIETPILMVLIVIFYLGSIIPIIAVTCRRMHDTGNSGWFQLIPIYGFILTLTEGIRGQNQYGPDPKNPSEGNEVDSIGTE